MSPWLEGAVVGLVASAVFQLAHAAALRVRVICARRATARCERESATLGWALATAYQTTMHIPGTVRWLVPWGRDRWAVFRVFDGTRVLGVDAWSQHQMARAEAQL